MKNSFRRSSFFVFSIALIFAVVMQSSVAEEKPISPLPPEGFQFTGEWDCRGAFANGTVHESRYSGSVILAGKWIELTEVDTKPATGYVAKYLIGYSPQEKRLIEYDANNFGAATYTSDLGWQSQTLVMTSSLASEPKAPYAMNRFQYAIQGRDTFTVNWQISKTANPEWKTADHLECSRTR